MFRVSFVQELLSNKLAMSCTNLSSQSTNAKFLKCFVDSSTSFAESNLYSLECKLIHTFIALVEY